ncbi:glutathione S-transferase family protein [Paracoccus sp. MBLB3053]|uniref:Glutathione S-transferase family protein n=1 Tax=Paracoccus aurantius TaxID=3073814 RepID=A0ABU2HYM1_9RHOB|nr:glutathione S-transferase family protein [Paracoccus sp. MBLB3053]MDS9469832.1 glutathione S-transferase family protein [Paracoccus sp. MBLB3053]
MAGWSDMLVLLQTPASPFARKVRMAALERGVKLRLEQVPVDPAARNDDLGARNPLAKIPVMLTPEGALYDSRVICRYLDRRGEGPSLYVAETADVWDILTLEALADGVMEAAVLLRYELVQRPQHLRWTDWIAAQFARIDAALDHAESRERQLGAPHIGAIGMAAALEYLDFRHPGHDWRARRAGLAAWLDRFSAQPIMRETSYRAA